MRLTNNKKKYKNKSRERQKKAHFFLLIKFETNVNTEDTIHNEEEGNSDEEKDFIKIYNNCDFILATSIGFVMFGRWLFLKNKSID